MELEFWATTDVGRVREHNEDNFLVDKRLKLFVVCDGMGGHAAGEVASAMSVKVVREVISSGKDLFEQLDRDPENLELRGAVLSLCERAIHDASQRIWQTAQEDSAKRGMGTTCSFLLLQDGRGFVGHVGDSRIYLNRGGQVVQVTEDHSLLNEMLRLGKIKRGEEHLLPNRNAVTRAVGVNEFVEVDTFEFDVFSGDQFLLCSDGLCGYFKTDEVIGHLMDTTDVREATERCIQFANESGGKDNITSIIVRVNGEVGRQRDFQQVMESLKVVPLFQYLGYKELVQVVNLGERRELVAGEPICKPTKLTRALFVVISGAVEFIQADVTRTVLPGEFFGEASLIDEEAAPFGATALENSMILRLHVDNFMELLRHDSDLAVKVLWNFLHEFTIRLRHTSGQLEEATRELASSAQRAVGPAAPEDDPASTPVPSHRVAEPEEDLKVTVDVDRTLDLDVNHLRAISQADAAEAAAAEAEGDITHVPTLKGTGALRGDPPSPSTEDLDWDGIDALLHDDVNEDDLRKTVQLGDLDREEKTRPSIDAIPADAKFSGISGESVSKTVAPKAQVFKRSKLVVGETEPSAADDDSTLADRLRKKRETVKKDVEDVS